MDVEGSIRGMLNFKTRNRNRSNEVSATAERSCTYSCKLERMLLAPRKCRSISPKGGTFLPDTPKQKTQKEAPFGAIGGGNPSVIPVCNIKKKGHCFRNVPSSLYDKTIIQPLPLQREPLQLLLPWVLPQQVLLQFPLPWVPQQVPQP